jgi:transposase
MGVCSHPAVPAAVKGRRAVAKIPVDLLERIGHLYQCEELSTYQIAAIAGLSRHRVTRLLKRMGIAVQPGGAGRHRPRRPRAAVSAEALRGLYLTSRLSARQISARTGIPEQEVRDRLRASGAQLRTRGRGSREDRTAVPPDAVAELYVQAGLSAAGTGQILGVSGRIVLRTAHDQGLPVRLGGPAPYRGPTDIELVDALYADPLVRRALDWHGLPIVPAGGAIWERFPQPLPLKAALAAELYLGCGLGITHIELLSGQPAETIRGLLHRHGVQLRPPGGRTPFMRRWRANPAHLGRPGQ